MSAFPGLVQRGVTALLAGITVIGLLYWVTGKHELVGVHFPEIRARIAASTPDSVARKSINRLENIFHNKEGMVKALLVPDDDDELTGDFVEKIFLNLTAINAALAVGMALLVVLRREVSVAGGYFALGMACFAFSLAWLLVSGQAPGRHFLPEVPVAIYYLGHTLALVCGCGCIAAMDGFFSRFPRRLEVNEYVGVLPKWATKPGDRDVYIFARFIVDSAWLTRWLPLVALVAAYFDLTHKSSFEGNWTDLYDLGTMLTIAVPSFWLLVMVASWCRVRAARQLCTTTERRQTDWFFAGLSFSMILLFGRSLLLIPSLLDASMRYFRGMVPLPSSILHGEIRYFLGVIFPVVGLIMLLSFGMSVFTRGAFDPSLLIRKATWIAVIAAGMSLILAIVQHLVTANILSHSSATMQNGLSTVLAGGIAVFSLGFFRVKMERGIDGFLNRFMPATVIADGKRRDLAVVFSDLGGYTALSAADEPQALHVAGHFQKAAGEIARRHGGRIVKTIGDAVMWVFVDSGEALAAVLELAAEFRHATEADKLPPLPVNSGVHFGSVVEAPGGDVYGAAVNLAARLQGVAKDGTVVASSEAMLEVTGGFRFEPLGKIALKNVPTPIACFRVLRA